MFHLILTATVERIEIGKIIRCRNTAAVVVVVRQVHPRKSIIDAGEFIFEGAGFGFSTAEKCILRLTGRTIGCPEGAEQQLLIGSVLRPGCISAKVVVESIERIGNGRRLLAGSASAAGAGAKGKIVIQCIAEQIVQLVTACGTGCIFLRTGDTIVVAQCI